MTEVKSEVSRGEPKVKIKNLMRMINTPNVQKIGLLLIPNKDIPLLFMLTTE